MTAFFKILGQSIPSAATNTTLYTVPQNTKGANSAVCSSIMVCNQSAIPTTFRIAVVSKGEETAAKNYIFYDIYIDGNDTFTATIGITLSEEDYVVVYATLATLSFSLFGQENVG